ncbi:hypothetical protein DFH09DRAFT_1318031 [Mycena vulgaris]|nr:hypothetical protein DFH09DRAFT_1318031 [Mycena vulgaris]
MASAHPRCIPVSNLPLRRTRSGKEFSAFDLALSRAIPPNFHFDIGESLQLRLAEQEATGAVEEEETVAIPAAAAPRAPAAAAAAAAAVAPAAAVPTALAPAPVPASSSLERSKIKSKGRRDKKRDKAQATSSNPLLKAVHGKRVEEGKKSALQLDLDAQTLPHSKPAWLGSRSAGEQDFDFTEPAKPHNLSSGLGGVIYTQEEVDTLSGTEGFMYIGWLGLLTIPLLDSRHRVIALLGGMPRDAGWKDVANGAAALLMERLPRIRLTEERLQHRRAQESFPAIARGWSHGGGQTEPGELCNNVANTRLTNELLAHEYFRRISGFANLLFLLWAPVLFTFYKVQMALLAGWKCSMRCNFPGSVFAACTFNFGPRAVCAPHLDFANLSWGWCAITALGDYDPDRGGHLILWDLRLVIRFPPGSTILIPSALIQHSNVPIHAHEHRCSFVRYTAGGLFRWMRNGFKTNEDWEASASREELAVCEAESRTRWERGMSMFSVIDDL